MTVEETYKFVYNRYFKFLSQNHMAEDRSKHLATIHAIKNTWKVYNNKENSKEKSIFTVAECRGGI